jgi:threonine dehydrogenase-like Zn-dependent dehydrogenase
VRGLAVDAKGLLSIIELDTPEIGPHQALVKTLACGVCSETDAKLIHGTLKGFVTYPALLGHEAVGEVVKIGYKVKRFRVGDVVLLPCLEEENSGCHPGWGGYAEYTVAGDYTAMPRHADIPETYYAQQVLPFEADPVKAVMIVTFREVLSAIRRFGLKAGEPAAVFGTGPEGLCFIRFCELLGLGPVVSADDGDDIIKRFPDGVENIICASGVNEDINTAMDIVKCGGKICVYGCSADPSMVLDWSRAPHNWQLLFNQRPSKTGEAAAHEQVMSWIKSGAVYIDDFIGDIVPFEDIISVFDEVLYGKAKKKTVIRY